MTPRVNRLASFVSMTMLVACGGTGASGFGLGDGSADGTTHRKGEGGIDLLPDSGAGSDGTGCTGIACNVQSCGAGAQTTVSGYVYAPNATLPLYDVQVFIPNAALEPFAKGVQCLNCGAPLSGEPITTALSDATGHFTLTGVPTGDDIPIVVQLGKWRRQTSIPKVTGCTETVLSDPDLTRLPRNQMEGSMPHVALTTGGCDQMGCMLPKMGIDPMEFGSQTDGYNKAINVYNGAGGAAGLGATEAMSLWGDAATLATYDEAIFSCECSESLTSKGGIGLGGAPFDIVRKYLDAGGRIFTTDYQYTWYKYSSDPAIGEAMSGSPTIGLGEIYGQAPPGTPPMTIVKTIPKAVALAAWLKYVFSGTLLPSGATYATDTYAQMGEINPDYTFGNIQWLDPSKSVTWATSPYEAEGYGGYGGVPPPPASSDGIEPRIFTVDTPVGEPSDKQCGRGVHIDAHVDSYPQTVGAGYPTAGCATPLKADEAAFAFFFFDLSSCISNEHQPPPSPPVK